MKAGPRQSQFQPTDGKIVKFADVHGVDEVKEVCCVIRLHRYLTRCIQGIARCRPVPQGPRCLCITRWQAAKRRFTDGVRVSAFQST